MSGLGKTAAMGSGPSKRDRRAVLRGGLASAAMLACPGIVRAQEAMVLRMSSWQPPTSLITENLFVPWADAISGLTGGRVAVELLPEPLGPPPAHRDLVQSGAADIAYSLHGYTPDSFQRARIGQFSFLGDAYSASHAFSKVYGKLLKAEEEHPSMRLLGLFQHGPGVMMLKDRTIATPSDFAGLRIRTSGGYIAALLEDLGAINVPMSPTKVREALGAGEIDGVAFPYEGGPSFGVMDEISFVSELPGGYYNATWFLAMSEAAAARLDPAVLAEIVAYSQETVHVLAAKAFDYADYLGKEEFLAKGVPIGVTDAALTEHIRALGSAYEASWSAELAEAGYEGERALAYTRRITGGN